MKIRSLFELANETRDLIDFFDGVETTDQMISRLERLKKTEAEDLLNSVLSTKISLEAALSDTLEIGGSELEDALDGDVSLESLGDEIKDENSESDAASPDLKNDAA